MLTQIPTLSINQRIHQGHESFRRIQKNKNPVPEKRVFSSKLSVTCNVRRTQARRENEASTKNGEKQDINAEVSRVGTFVRYKARDVLKSNVKIDIRLKKTCVHVLHCGPIYRARPIGDDDLRRQLKDTDR